MKLHPLYAGSLVDRKCDEFKYFESALESKGVNLAQQVNALQAKILKELLADGRKTDREIAEEIGVSKEEIKRNLAELEKAQIIRGATTHINYRLFGFKAVAHVIIRIDPSQVTQFSAYLQKMPEVYDDHHIQPG